MRTAGRVGIDLSLAPDRFPACLTTIVRLAYFEWLQAAQRDSLTTWADFAEEHYSSLIEPNHLVRCLDMLETLSRLDDAAAWDNWTKRREEESARRLSALRYRRALARRPTR